MIDTPKARTRNAVDEHVGQRLRARRKALKMNQSTLAARLGVTFQMVQRYEYGLCRISASMLYAAAMALDVPVAFFFDGLPLPAARHSDMAPPDWPPNRLPTTRDERLLAAWFPRIPHRGSRRAIVELVRVIAGEV